MFQVKKGDTTDITADILDEKTTPMVSSDKWATNSKGIPRVDL